MSVTRLFASDNTSSVHPEVMRALAAANDAGHRISYGDDDFTDTAVSLFRDIFGGDCALWFVYNGTAANVVAIRSLIKGYQSVLAPHTAHIEEDECGSLEALAGVKIEFLPESGGKISADDIPSRLGRLGFVHSVQPALVSVTQSTELGQRYSIDELQAIGRMCREQGLLLHMDGARIANAVAGELAASEPAWQNLSSDALSRRGREILSAMTVEAGVNALSLGGTKNGLMFGEGIVLMNGAQSNTDLSFYRKQTAQLASKMRYISAQFDAMYRGDVWLRNALHSNELARQLEAGINRLSSTVEGAAAGLRVKHPVSANALFAVIPHAVAKKLQERYQFYAWDEDSYRLMTSWDSTAEDVENLLQDLESLIKLNDNTGE
jgi:threonine aldolase